MNQNFYKHLKLYLVNMLMILSTAVQAQSQSVVIDDNRVSIEQAFRKIEKQTGYLFVLSKSDIDVTRRVELPAERMPLGDMLDMLLKYEGCDYKFHGKNIIIVRSHQIQPKTGSETTVVEDVSIIRKTITGVVVDAQTDRPIMGAQVSVSGMVGKAAETNHAGQFVIKGIPVGAHRIRTYKEGYYLSDRGMEISQHRDDEINIPLKTTSVNLGSIRNDADKGGIVTAETSSDAADAIAEIPRDTIAVEIPIVETYESKILQPYLHGIHRNDTKWGIKTNLLYLATLSPNIGVEWRMAPKWTAEITAGLNAWDVVDDIKYKHWVIKPEVRYWFCRSFDGHFFGLHGIVGQFNVKNMPMNRMFPLGFTKELEKDKAYRGWGYGGGIDYGYQWAIGKHWNLEAAVGVGYMRFEYDKYTLYDDCKSCHGRDPRNYFGVTKAGISLIYIIK